MAQKSASPKEVEPPPTLPEGVKGSFDLDAVKDYAVRPESSHAYLRVELHSFEGPLDLLLHLIQKHALDILDIPISFITERFLEVLVQMKSSDIDVAAEFLVMAATLAHIKSKMLLPPDQATDAEDAEDLDPRAELMRRLLAYQKYKQAAADLLGRGLLFRDVWPRGRAGLAAQAVADTRVDLTAMDLIAALEEVLRGSKVPLSHEVILERVSVGARIAELLDLCRQTDSFTFEVAVLHACEGIPDRSRVVITLLSVLEMAKLKLVRIHQALEGGAIYISPNKENLAAVDVEAVEKDYV